MIKILTSEGTSLDLVKGCEFEIEYNNPMFDDTRMPVPFSTQIDLLPTATNCKVLSWLPALKMAPGVKQLAVSLNLNGLDFLKGMLIFDSIEDGRACYTFSGRSQVQDWGEKLWQYNSGYWVAAQFKVSGVSAFQNYSESNGVVWPLIVNKEFTGHFVAGHDDISYEISADNDQSVNLDVKYWNPSNVIPESGCGHIMPAILASKIFNEMGVGMGSISKYLNHICILAPFGLKSSYSENEFVYPAKNCPDISFSEFYKNIAYIFCMAIFPDVKKPGYYKIVGFNDMAGCDDWTEKVSDDFSSQSESGKNYSISFNNSDDETPSSDSEIIELNSIKASLFPSPVPDLSGQSAPYTKIYTGRASFPGKSLISATTILRNYAQPINPPGLAVRRQYAATAASDCLYNRNFKYKKSNIATDDSEDITVEMDLVKCTPQILNNYTLFSINDHYKSLSTLIQRCSLAAMIESTENDETRPSTPIIGVYHNGQMSPDGISLVTSIQTPAPSDGVVSRYTDVDGPRTNSDVVSLLPVDLFNKFHKNYADWLSKDKQVIVCDVDLSEFDLAGLDLSRKARIHGRDFYVRKITVTIKEGVGQIACSVEFISC